MRVKHLLKPAAHEHKDPQVRLTHVRELDPEDDEAAEVLARLAQGDADHAVRRAAISRLNDLAVLRSLLAAEPEESGDGALDVREAAEARLAAMIETGTVSDVAVRVLLEDHAARLARVVATHSPVAAQRELALDAIDDEAALVGVVQSSRLHDARLAAASRLTRHDTMRAALLACRSRDKVVAKLLQQRLDAEAAAEAERIATAHAVTTTLESTRALAGSVWSPQYGGRAQALRARWSAFEASDTAAHAEAFAAADARVQAVIDEHARAAAPAGDEGASAPGDTVRPAETGDASPAEPPAATGPAGGASADAGDGKDRSGGAVPEPDAAAVALAERLRPVELDALAAALDDDGSPSAAAADGGDEPATAPTAAEASEPEASDGAAEPGERAASASATTPSVREPASPSTSAGGGGATAEALRAHARAVAVLFDPPFDHQKARPGALRQRLARVDALLDTGALLPGLDLSSQRYVQALGEHRATLAERLTRAEQESTDRVKATHRQFAALGGIIGEGKWAPANSLLRRLQKKLAAMEPAERAGLDDKLARAEKQLAEMGDWQDFAARPKLETLCTEMEALPARELVPTKLAKAVRDLQSQWKALGPSRAANELWPRFKTAGDTAYEPCKAFFAARGEEREAKLAARRAICDALEADVAMLGRALATPAPEADAGKRADAKGATAAIAGDASRGEGEAGAPGGSEGGVAEASGPDGQAAEPSVGEDVADAALEADAPKAADGAGVAEADGADVEAGSEDGVAAASSEGAAGAREAGSAAGTDGADDGTSDGETPAATGGAGTAPDLADAPEPDWKAVQRRVGDAKREWSRNRVVDRKPDRALEARFTTALAPYERALKAHYAANETEKRALIDKAAALAAGEIDQHAANRAKTLLAAWKQVGLLPRRTDQALWETFNGHLGTVFKQRQAVVREKRRAGLEHVDRARAIARELRALAKGASVDEGAVQALADEFHALPDFPERDRRGLERDFRAALDSTARVAETAGKRRRQAEREERLRLVGLCERLEHAIEAGEADATLVDDVRHAWEASETRVAREMAARLEARRDAALAHLEAGTGYDLAANEEARRDLLIRMEIAADVETPPEDKGRRMRYQLENLQAGMTSAAVADRRATLAALEEEWLAAPPAAQAVHDALHSRYLKALGR